jgi:hypothetical protein
MLSTKRLTRLVFVGLLGHALLELGEPAFVIAHVRAEQDVADLSTFSPPIVFAPFVTSCCAIVPCTVTVEPSLKWMDSIGRSVAFALSPSVTRFAPRSNDLVMPGLGGESLATRLIDSAHSSSLRVRLCGGATRDRAARNSSSFLAKPFTPVQLALAVRAVLDR